MVWGGGGGWGVVWGGGGVRGGSGGGGRGAAFVIIIEGVRTGAVLCVSCLVVSRGRDPCFEVQVYICTISQTPLRIITGLHLSV